MPTLYLHVGSHKTGTTAIQAFAAQHRGALAERQLIYPDYEAVSLGSPNAHHWVAHALANDKTVPITVGDVSILLATFSRHARDEAGEILLSAEAFYRHVLGEGAYGDRLCRYLIQLADVLKWFDVVPILVLRRPDEFLRSLYQERVMRGCRPQKPFARYLAIDHYLLNYHANATQIRDHFPQLRTYIYEDLAADGHLVTNFFKAIGVDVSDLDDVGVIRKSLTAPETLVKNYANEFVSDRKASRCFMKWMHTPRVRRRIARAYGRREYDLWSSHEVRQEFLASRADDLRALQRDFFADREELFPPLRSGDTLPPAPELPDKLRKMVDSYIRRYARAHPV